MLCEQVSGKLHDFDTTGKTLEFVDIEWHEAFKKIHKKTTDKGTEVGIRMDDSVLARGLYQDDVIYADETKLVVINTPPCEVIRVSFEPGHEKMRRFSGEKMPHLLLSITNQCLLCFRKFMVLRQKKKY
mgnify:CR=1 FL=1